MEFADVGLDKDTTRFSGRLVPSDSTPEGRIDGVFMGPGGAEIAMRAFFPTLPQLQYPYLAVAKRNP